MGTDSSEEQKKLSSFLMLAEQADQSGNHQEAFSFYTKALEIEPLNPDAWFGKGKAAGWCSTVLNSRLLEMVQGISNAVKFAPDERKADLSVQGAAAINSTANALYNAAYKLYQEDVDSRKLCWTAFEQCLRALDAAHELNPKSIKLMESILIFVNNLGPVFGGSDAQKGYANQLKAKYEVLVKELDPNHTIPTSGCFVVTATLGDEKNIFVKDFRFLRDSVMVQYRLGQSFANWYYKYGPIAASIIQRSVVLRLAAFGLVVLPAYLIVKPMLLAFRKR